MFPRESYFKGLDNKIIGSVQIQWFLTTDFLHLLRPLLDNFSVANFFKICFLSLNGKMTPNSAVSHEILFPKFKIQPHCTCFCDHEPFNFQTMQTFPLSH